MWDARYAEPGFAYGKAPNDFLAECAPRLEGPVLSLAEGEGRNAVYLATRDLEVLGVDASSVGLAKARGLAAEHGVSIATEVADLASYSIPVERYGAIVSVWCHVPKAIRVGLHRACAQGLKPGGLFVLEAYTPSQVSRGTGGPRDPSLCMTLADLRQELQGLEFLVGRELEREVHEGAYHEGRSATVQVLARRPL